MNKRLCFSVLTISAIMLISLSASAAVLWSDDFNTGAVGDAIDGRVVNNGLGGARNRSVDSGLVFCIWAKGNEKAQFHLPETFIPAAIAGKSGHALGFEGADSQFYVDDVLMGKRPLPTHSSITSLTPTPTPVSGNGVLFSDNFDDADVGNLLSRRVLNNYAAFAMVTGAAWSDDGGAIVDDTTRTSKAAFGSYSATCVPFTANPSFAYQVEALGRVNQGCFADIAIWHRPGDTALWLDPGIFVRIIRFRPDGGYSMDALVAVGTDKTGNPYNALKSYGSADLTAGMVDANNYVPVKIQYFYCDTAAKSHTKGVFFANGQRVGQWDVPEMLPAGNAVGIGNPHTVGFWDNFKVSQIPPSSIIMDVVPAQSSKWEIYE